MEVTSLQKKPIINVQIISANQLLILGITAVIEKDFNFNCNYLLAETLDQTIKADLIIYDLSHGFLASIRKIKIYKNTHPESKILVLSNFDELTHAKAAISAGANAFLEYTTDQSQFIEAFKNTLDGSIYLAETTKNFILESMFKENKEEALTRRELEVVLCLGSGKTCKECALELSCSHKTVNVHRSNIKAKLNISTNMKFIKYCYLQHR
jgi:NarL family two-component system response regulator LiaR